MQTLAIGCSGEMAPRALAHSNAAVLYLRHACLLTFDVFPGIMVIDTAANVACQILLLQEFSEKVMPVGDIEVAHLSALDVCRALPNALKG